MDDREERAKAAIEASKTEWREYVRKEIRSYSLSALYEKVFTSFNYRP